MRIFETDGKTNFCDTNDVLVGFDSWQSCCEDFGHVFTLAAPTEYRELPKEVEVPNLEDLVFDPEFFNDFDNGESGWAVFRLFLPQRQESDRVMREKERVLKANGTITEVFLLLYNHHNGYYSHGFTMENKGTMLREGSL